MVLCLCRSLIAVGKGVDMSRRELSCRDLVLEQNVNFCVCPALEFWNSEVGPNGAKEADTTPVQSDFSSPVNYWSVQYYVEERATYAHRH